MCIIFDIVICGVFVSYLLRLQNCGDMLIMMVIVCFVHSLLEYVSHTQKTR